MKRQVFYRWAIGLGVANYLVYAVATLFAGGDVLHGLVTHGHFFAAARGGFVEVAPALFEFCRWHPYTLLVSFPLLLWGGFHLAPEPRVSDEFVLSQGD
jgi:hypothetical protein